MPRSCRFSCSAVRLLTVAILAAAIALPMQTVAGEPRDQLVVAIKGEPADGYDPTLGWGRYGHPLFQSTLLKRDQDLNVVPDLATNHRLSADGLRWEITIRDDARFSDGTPVRASDVAYTFNTAAKAGGKVDLAKMEIAEALDDLHVLIRLKQRDTTFLGRLITLGIVPEKLHGPEYSRRPVGSGPYVLTSWAEGQQMVAEANPLYYGTRPYFRKIVFLFTDEDTSFAAAKAGQVQMVVVPQSLARQEVEGMHLVAVKSVDNRGLMFPTVPDVGAKTEDGLSMGNSVTADPAVRKAINLAIDRKLLVDGVLDGFGRPAFGVCDGLPWDNQTNQFKDNDRQTAIELLERGGWVDKDGDGIREKDGQRAAFTILYPADRTIRQYLALAVKDMLQSVGIAAAVEGRSWDEIKPRVHSEVILFGWGSHDPIEMYHLYSSRFSGQGYDNPGFYHNPVVDEHLEAAINAHDFQQSIRHWQQAQWDGTNGANTLGDAPWAWLVNLDHTYFVNDRLDIGTPQIEPHGHGWPITANIVNWKWVN